MKFKRKILNTLSKSSQALGLQIGVNAFFVREDLVGDDLFLSLYTSEQHFQKQLYLLERHLGHKRNHNLVNSIAKL